jgi:hypothetical protein
MPSSSSRARGVAAQRGAGEPARQCVANLVRTTQAAHRRTSRARLVAEGRLETAPPSGRRLRTAVASLRTSARSASRSPGSRLSPAPRAASAASDVWCSGVDATLTALWSARRPHPRSGPRSSDDGFGPRPSPPGAANRRVVLGLPLRPTSRQSAAHCRANLRACRRDWLVAAVCAARLPRCRQKFSP